MWLLLLLPQWVSGGWGFGSAIGTGLRSRLPGAASGGWALASRAHLFRSRRESAFRSSDGHGSKNVMQVIGLFGRVAGQSRD